MSYQTKYLKYKTKYHLLKTQRGGGKKVTLTFERVNPDTKNTEKCSTRLTLVQLIQLHDIVVSNKYLNTTPFFRNDIRKKFPSSRGVPEGRGVFIPKTPGSVICFF